MLGSAGRYGSGVPKQLSLDSWGRTAPSGKDCVKGFRGPGVGGTRKAIGDSPATLEEAEAVRVFAKGCRDGLLAPPRMNGCVLERPKTDESPAGIGLENENPSIEALCGRVFEAASPGLTNSPSMQGFGRGDAAGVR